MFNNIPQKNRFLIMSSQYFFTSEPRGLAAFLNTKNVTWKTPTLFNKISKNENCTLKSMGTENPKCTDYDIEIDIIKNRSRNFDEM